MGRLAGSLHDQITGTFCPSLSAPFPSIYAHSVIFFTSRPPHSTMSKKFKSQASSSRAAASTFGAFGGFSGAFSSQGREPSALTYVAEPPDLSRLSEAQLGIAFKNFLKKDEVTRTRALDDLRDHVAGVESRGGTLDDGFLEAWVGLYPHHAPQNNKLIMVRDTTRLKSTRAHP